MRLGEFAQRHARGIVSIALFVAALGAVTVPRMPVAILPDFPYPRIAVIADAGDMAVDNVVISITRPLEDAASSVPGVSRVRSRTSRGSVEMSVDFEWDQDMFEALSYLRSGIDAVRPDLPPDVELTVERQDPSSFPVIGYSLTSRRVSQADLRETTDLLIAPTLRRLQGVYRVLVQGGDIREFTVGVDPEALAAHHVSATDVSRSIEATNLISSVGRFDRRYRKYLVTATSEMTDADTIRDAVVALRDGVPVRVGDVARVEQSSEERLTAVTANGQPAVLFSILKQRGASTVDVSREVAAALADLSSGLPPDVEVKPFYDESRLLTESIGSVRDSILIGAVLAIIVLILFLGSLRASAVVIATLPITVLSTMLLLRLLGETLNLMTLGGLAVGLGLIIDDVVVTVENIHRHLQEGADVRRAVSEGTAEITKPMVGSSLTTISVFLPLVALGGIAGAFFSPLALTLTVMLIVSMALALTAAPALCGWMLRRPAGDGQAHHASRAVVALAGLYERLLRWVLARRRVVLISALALPALTVIMYRALPTGFMPDMDEGAFILDYLTPDGTSLAETDRQLLIVEKILMEQPEVEAYSRRTGLELGFFATEQNTGDIAVSLKPKSQRRRSVSQVIEKVRERCLREVPGMECEFVLIVQDRVGDMAGEPSPVEVKIFGSEPPRLREIAGQVAEIVASVPGVVDETDGIVSTGPELSVHVDPAKAGLAGMTPEDVIDQLSALMLGSQATIVRQGERMIGVRVVLPPPLRRTEEQINRLRLVTPSGATVPVGSLATIEENEGTMEMEREDQKPVVAVTANLEGRDLGSAIQEIRSRIDSEVSLPEGYTLRYGGLYETQQSSFRRLLSVFLIGMALVLVVAIWQYEALSEPLALFVSALFSEVGVIGALFLTGTPFNASSFTGAIMVFGMVLTNGIVLMDYTRQRGGPRVPLVEAVVAAGKTRVRPVLMTSVIATLALLPLALGIGAGAEMQRPLAIAVIGGLITSPLFALVLSPAILVALRARSMARSG